MKETGELTADRELITQFESGSLPASAFHHADHVRMGFAYLRQYPLLQAMERFSTALQRFAQAQGKPNLYHATITWAYLFLIQERIVRVGGQQSWEEFARANPDLLTWKNGILQKYYSEQTLRSELAKGVFLLPDKVFQDRVLPDSCS
jgi:hypothetical protein